MEEFFIPYSRDCDFWDEEGGYKHPSREFWNWAEVMLGEGLTISIEPTPEKPWAICPGNRWVNSPDLEQGGYQNGRIITFLDPTLAMLFKLRWI
jgi:hypothetical protein